MRRFKFGQDHRDSLVVVVRGEAPDEGDGLLVGDPQVPAGFGHRHRDFGHGSALPDDAQVGDAPLAVHGDADLGDHRADELFAFAHRGRGCIEDRADVGAGGGDPGQFLFG